jgi:hypothetical protein
MGAKPGVDLGHAGASAHCADRIVVSHQSLPLKLRQRAHALPDGFNIGTDGADFKDFRQENPIGRSKA